jgi:hypothetical protein
MSTNSKASKKWRIISCFTTFSAFFNQKKFVYLKPVKNQNASQPLMKHFKNNSSPKKGTPRETVNTIPEAYSASPAILLYERLSILVQNVSAKRIKPVVILKLLNTLKIITRKVSINNKKLYPR